MGLMIRPRIASLLCPLRRWLAVKLIGRESKLINVRQVWP